MGVVEFPIDIKQSLIQHLNRPKASSCSDPDLFKVLKRYNADSTSVFLEDLDHGERFILHDTRLFSKGKKKRTRFECLNVATKKIYLFNQNVEVKLYKS